MKSGGVQQFTSPIIL